MRIKTATAIFKHPVNKLFTTDYTYHDTNQTEKEREQKLRPEAGIIGELQRKCDCYLCEHWEEGVFEHCKCQSFT